LDAVVDEVRQNGNWAWTRGHFVAVFDEKTDSAPPGVAGERHGKFLLIWERQDDGTWLVVMDIGNRLPAPVVTTQSDAGLYYSCRSCHGEHGEGNEAMDAPAIAGMDAEYLATQMRHFRDGVRGATLDDLEGRQMNLIAAIFEDDRQIDALANFIQTMPREKPPRVLAESPVGAAQRFALCAACHGPNGEGNRLLGGPAIAWLDDWYIALQLQKFRDGIRGADAADVRGQQMRAAASALSDDEIRELAAFVVTLPGRASGN
jgi:cytochrome c oxidase subunit 2